MRSIPTLLLPCAGSSSLRSQSWRILLAVGMCLSGWWGTGTAIAYPFEPQPSADSEPADAPQYVRDIAPLLKSKCLRCHGEKERKAELDLRTAASRRQGGESGPVIVPGKPEESLLLEKIQEGSMPPDRKERLTDAEVELVRRWIETGAAADEEQGQAADRALHQHDVLPILLRRCAPCHGAGQQEGELDVRSRAGLLRGGKSGPAIVPGKPEESPLIRKIQAGEMPPLRRLIEVSIKPIEPAETETLSRWIAQGAPEVEIQPDVATTDPDPLVTEEDRAFWSFQPPRDVPPPTPSPSAPANNPIDAFLLERLEPLGLSLSPQADRLTLLRRLCYDLTGLPPDPSQIQEYLSDRSPDAYERLVERLLNSPRYGERWGRHWLDVAGYADSEGKREQDLDRNWAYRYRDYVIRAFASDKPYDRFLLEQIAGDELEDYEHAPEITQEQCDNLVATGFLRMAPDPTWYNLTNFVPDRLDVLADEIEVLTSGVLGLTMKCARCHTHKFDPIPHRDYFRLVDVFKGAFDEHDWMKSNWHPGLSKGPRTDRDLPYVTTAERRAWEASTTDLQRRIAALRSPLEEAAAALTKKLVNQRIDQLPAEIREDVRSMLATPADQRTAVQTYLAEKFEKELRIDRASLPALDEEFRKVSEAATTQIAELEKERRPEPKLRALWDRGAPSPTYIYRRGDYLNPGRLVGPGVPSVLTDGRTPFEVHPPWPGANKTGRRLALARWLTRPDNPLTARVLVNRLWKHHFGAGLVRTLDNFGKTGSPPSHPELLDWLAREFVRRGWSIKEMHRLMVGSAAYRQLSVVTAAHEQLDPDNRWLSRMPLQRLSAEQLYDALLAVSGRLDETRFGPPDPVDVRDDGLTTPKSVPGGGWRRGIYVQQQRKVVVTHLENFDFPAMNPNCIERRDSIVALQALHLFNNGMVEQLAEQFARRVESEGGGDRGRQIERAYLTAFGRPPQPDELALAATTLERLTEEWSKKVRGPAAAGEGTATGNTPGDEAAHKALCNLCHALINAAEFLYID
ncbi:MAG: PSD1 and planctomycete cytochrome C domain-containing protein [Planctomycetales bacterium]